MHLRAIHAENHIPTLRSFIRANPLGLITTALESPNYPLLQTSHIPFILDVQNESDEAERGILRGHMARANPQTKAMIEQLSSNGGQLEKKS